MSDDKKSATKYVMVDSGPSMEEEEIERKGVVEVEVWEGVDEGKIDMVAMKVVPHGVGLIGAAEAARGRRLKVVARSPSIENGAENWGDEVTARVSANASESKHDVANLVFVEIMVGNTLFAGVVGETTVESGSGETDGVVPRE